jgi:hypothetical protein
VVQVPKSTARKDRRRKAAPSRSRHGLTSINKSLAGIYLGRFISELNFLNAIGSFKHDDDPKERATRRKSGFQLVTCSGMTWQTPGVSALSFIDNTISSQSNKIDDSHKIMNPSLSASVSEPQYQEAANLGTGLVQQQSFCPSLSCLASLSSQDSNLLHESKLFSDSRLNSSVFRAASLYHSRLGWGGDADGTRIGFPPNHHSFILQYKQYLNQGLHWKLSSTVDRMLKE